MPEEQLHFGRHSGSTDHSTAALLCAADTGLEGWRAWLARCRRSRGVSCFGPLPCRWGRWRALGGCLCWWLLRLFLTSTCTLFALASLSPLPCTKIEH